MNKWDKQNRFDSAREWIEASNIANSVALDDDIIDALAELCVKRQGVWRLRKTSPKPKEGAKYFVYQAFRIARHASQWGNLAPWGESLTAELMVADCQDRALFDRAFDQFLAAAKARQGAANATR